jgi:hypothetical protein
MAGEDVVRNSRPDGALVPLLTTETQCRFSDGPSYS